jgi:hypothetical protein
VDKSGFGFSIHGPSLLNMSQACRPLLAKKKNLKQKLKKYSSKGMLVVTH